VKYLPLSPKDRAEMLDIVGVESLDDLFVSIPEHLRLKEELNIPAPKSEMEILQYFSRLAGQNTTFNISFLGGGAYDHYCPSVVDHLCSRQEFFTAYTPYQPEVSQGTLQALFEFQTMISELSGLDVANASVYDGATGMAEAVLMATRIQRKKKRLLVSSGIHPFYLEVLKTYISNLPVDLVLIPNRDNVLDLNALDVLLGNDVIAVVAGYPNFFGFIEPLELIAEKAHACKALVISVTQEALSLALLKSPGDCQVDIAVGEAQSFGIPLQFGGPYCGFFTCKDKYKRQIPGRLCGQTLDSDGKRAFVLTLSAREQHIRRAKATSNICTNQGLMALRVAIYLSTLGKDGLRELAIQNHSKAEYLKTKLSGLKGVSIHAGGKTFNEFIIELPESASLIIDRLRSFSIEPGLDLGRFFPDRAKQLLINVTEVHSRADMDTFAAKLKEVL
jgi:glycine dehydrogenase subunit 1